MKLKIAIALLLALSLTIQAQQTKMSPKAKIALKSITNGEKGITGKLGATITLAEGIQPEALKQYGINVNTVVGKRMTVKIPAEHYADLVASGICSFIEMGEKMYHHTDRARADMGIDYIYQGVNLPHGYDGSGVIFGIIDDGFEYNNPAFYDSTGTTLRIKTLWQQSDDRSLPPLGLSYGSEYTTQTTIIGACTDDSNNSHGTCNAAIGAGCGVPNEMGRRYRGIAPAADIAIVACDLSSEGVLDGIHYLHNYARSVGKPCVINISLGSNIGPHDGLDEFDNMITEYLYTTPPDSLVVVVSAGNAGNAKKHLHKSFHPTDTVLNTYIENLESTNYNSVVECWGDVGDEFSVAVTLNKSSNSNIQAIEELPFVPSNIDTTYTFELLSPENRNYTCTLVTNPESPVNHRPHIYVQINSNDGSHLLSDLFSLSIKSTSANLHAWTKDNFTKRTPNSTDGDYDYVIEGVGGNTDGVITVGSYTTRSRLDNGSALSLNENGELSSFSSNGPTYDGRVKPDICAPGQFIASAENIYDHPNTLSMEKYDSITWNGQKHYFNLNQGTSMASPFVSGIIALWMQENPSLNVVQAREILHSTALQDIFTDTIPVSGSNKWGWGKVNPYGGLPATTLPNYKITALSENWEYGHVAGGGIHPQGEHAVEAIPNGGYAFSHWNDGNSDNPRIINLMSDTTLEASFIEAECDTVSEFPWNAMIDKNNERCWENTGVSEWFIVPGGTVTSLWTVHGVNTLVTPHILVAPQTAYYCRISSTNGDSVRYTVIIPDEDTIVMADPFIPARSEGEVRFDLTPFAGQVVRIGICNHMTGTFSICTLESASIDYFQKIEDVDSQSGSRVKVHTSGLNITVENPDCEKVSLFDIAGRQLSTSQSAAFSYQCQTPGVYLVKSGNRQAQKVVVMK